MDQRTLSLEELTVSLEAPFYNEFFRKRGAFKENQFVTPRVSDVGTFDLPRASVMHYLPESDVELGPNPSHLFLRKATGRMLAEHVFQLASVEGNPIPMPGVLPNTLMAGYRKQYLTIRPLRDITTAMRDDRTVIIENYAMLNHLFKYRVVPQARLFKFRNMLNTVVARMEEIVKVAPNHQQWLQIGLPTTIPTKQQFVMGKGILDRSRMRLFPDDRSLFLLELWKWIGEERSTSILSKLSDEALAKINLVFTEKGKYAVINLGIIDSWRKRPDVKNSKGYSPQQMQVSMYLKFLASLEAIRTVGADNVVVTKTPKATDDPDAEPEVIEIISEGEAIAELATLEEESKNYDDSVADTADVQQQFTPLDIGPVAVEPPAENSSPDQVQGVQKRIQALAEDGRLSAAEQRYYEQKALAYKTIPNPYGPGTLEDLSTITPKDLELRPYVIEDIPLTLDKSMLETSLKPYFQKYLGGGILQKDIAASIMGAQNAGIAITDCRVEKNVDALNKYDVHIVEFTPVGGAKSTWRFKAPSFNKDGIMKSSGIKYRLRSQRGDEPIRKTKPYEVALSSYYPTGKLFIRRSQKKVDDYSTWLGNQVFLAAEAKRNVTASLNGSCFQREYKTPRTFSALSNRLRMLQTGPLTIIFDRHLLSELFGVDAAQGYDKLIAKHLANGDMLVGKVGNDLLLMANAGHLYNATTGEVYGSIEELLQIDLSKAPVDAAIISVMGKDIPMAMFLGQKYGLSNLLRVLKVPHRFVVRGSRMNLEPGEYVVKFKDQYLVLHRDHQVASLIFASLNSYSRAVEDYDYAEFDQHDVYGALYLKMGLNPRYSREIDNMFDLYIDHITKGPLEVRGEPTRFGPLLIRAVELLTNDAHPKLTDGTQLRIRGYERIAGRVYREMCKGVRVFKDKPLSSKSKIEINPYDVWNSIVKDPALTIIEESNPIHEMKERGNITYAGTDGRSSRTMVRKAREYDRNDMGVISGDTVDNGDVAVTVFASYNPQLGSLRGETKDFERSKEHFKKNPAQLLSPTGLIAPAINYDD